LEVDKELEAMGVKVKEQFAVLGPYDFVNIVDAPDNLTIMKASTEIGSRGSVQLLTFGFSYTATILSNPILNSTSEGRSSGVGNIKK